MGNTGNSITIGGVKFVYTNIVSQEKKGDVYNVKTNEGTLFMFAEQDPHKNATVYSKSMNAQSPITTRVQNFDGGVAGNPNREDIIDVVKSDAIVITKDDKNREDTVMSDSPTTRVMSDSGDKFIGQFLDTTY